MASPKNSKEDKQLAILQDKINELTEALQRERADAVNIRRRAEEDRLKMASYFKAVAVKDLLPFIDNFERALSHAPKTEDTAQGRVASGSSRRKQTIATSIRYPWR